MPNDQCRKNAECPMTEDKARGIASFVIRDSAFFRHSSLGIRHSLPSLHVAGHDLTLFVETPPLVGAMLRDIHAARQRVWLESYIFLDDAAGQAVADALAERSRAGLDVRVHYDAIGCMSVSSVFFQHLEEAESR